jgi:hypothetical protein
MKNIFLVIFISIIFFSCEKTIVLDLKDMEPRIVIEGLVTNAPGRQYIKITKSVDFYSSVNDIPAVKNAIVTVTDDLNNTFVFIHNPNDHADSAGYYVPEDPFTGEIGRTYTLHVEADGETYTAEDKMFSVTPIDKLEYRINEDEKDDPKETEKIYEVLVFAKEPQETKDYYLFKFYRNDSLKFDSENDIYYSDDELLAENIDGVPSPNFYGIGDKAKVEAYSLTRNGLVFYADLFKLINNDGGLFGPPPANCRTNLTNGALGFFQVSAFHYNEITITE